MQESDEERQLSHGVDGRAQPLVPQLWATQNASTMFIYQLYHHHSVN